jgi:hypothetical protein
MDAGLILVQQRQEGRLVARRRIQCFRLLTRAAPFPYTMQCVHCSRQCHGELYQIPDDVRPLTGLANGYADDENRLPRTYQKKTRRAGRGSRSLRSSSAGSGG